MTSYQKIRSPKIRLADDAYQQILSVITSGEISPTKKIAQEKLAEKMGISRTPVREALMRLTSDGILENGSHGGFYVRKLGEAEVRNIYQARGAIEGYAARILAEYRDIKKLQQINSIILFEESLEFITAAEVYDSNRKIHRAFVERTENSYLLDMFDQMWNRALCIHMFSKIPNVADERLLGDHFELVTVISDGDPAKAEAAMRLHIQEGLDLQLSCM